MSNKELLIQEIESLPLELLTEALDFIRFLKVSHAQRQLESDINPSSNTMQQAKTNRYPLQGTQPYRYDDPTEPVALEDWEFLQ